jgi:hypothetical protein
VLQGSALLEGADGLDIDAGRFGKTGDRHRGKGWHGAGVAFENNRKSLPDRKAQ